MHPKSGSNHQENNLSSASQPKELLGTGKWLCLVRQNGWESVERCRVSGVVAVLAMTNHGDLLLIEQFRSPVGASVLELPAGLAGDLPGSEHEPFEAAARRELFEETGYQAASWEYLTQGPSSAGLTNEIVHFFQAKELEKKGLGGGDASENLIVHEVPLTQVPSWLKAREQEGVLIDFKIYTALFFAQR